MTATPGIPHKVQVFTRLPRAGRTKTRLIPALGPAGAAGLHAALLARMLDAACAACADVEVWVSDPDEAGPMQDGCGQWPVTVRTQVAGDLGARMHHALASALAGGARPVLVGSDCPLLDRACLDAAFAALAAGNDVVLGPVEDGGYGLIGLGQDCPELFTAMPWSTAQVLARTLQAATGRGRRWHLLPTTWDVDRPADLERLRACLPELVAAGERRATVPWPGRARRPPGAPP